jgi:hypothetical protein
VTCSVLVVGLPSATGGAPGNTWRAAAAFVQKRLAQRFGDRVAFEYAELFSPDMVRHPDIEADIAAGRADLPIVVIDGVRQFSGGKLNVGAVERAVAAALGAASSVGLASASGTDSAARTGSASRIALAARTGPASRIALAAGTGPAGLLADPANFTSTTEGRVS